MNKEIILQKIDQVENCQEKKYKNDSWCLTHHLMPPAGWLNDPNGLCEKDGIYHVFFQYSPFDANGGDKYWGHYESRDLIHWSYTGIAVSPDTEWDKDGAYSGSALVEKDEILLYYTGNVKQDGDYDFTYKGREANTILIRTRDGISLGEKKLLMTNADYGNNLSCHVRDPKVWKEDGTYYMVQGARTMDDVGIVLVFQSEDLEHWKRINTLHKKELGAYMWECPDLFKLQNQGHEKKEMVLLSFSPQGMKAERTRYQNIYQSGYSVLTGNYHKQAGACEVGEFEEWDYGFDFYAPQTFEDESGRRILIGWMGMADCDYTNPTVMRGWQHALTIPRVITCVDGKIYKNPVEEMKSLRSEETSYHGSAEIKRTENAGLEMLITGIKDGGFQWVLGGMKLSYSEESHIFSMEFTDNTGSGRGRRMVELERLDSLQIFLDTSAIEIYINNGEKVMTSRYYLKEPLREQQALVKIQTDDADIRCFKLNNIENEGRS